THDLRTFSLTLKDRVRIYDARLPGGVAVGKVDGLEFDFSNAAIASISLMCPVSDPAQLSSLAVGVGTDGLAKVLVNSTISSADLIENTDILDAVGAGNGAALVSF